MNSKLGLLYGLIASLIWGGMYVVSKVVLEVVPPFGLLSLRLIFGLLALSLVSAYKNPSRIRVENKMKLVWIGMIGYGISLALQFIGTKLSTAANGAVVTSASPAFVYIFSFFIMREKISWRRIIALAISSLGVIIVINPSSIQLSPELFWGNVALLGAAVTWGLYSVLVRRATFTTDTLSLSLVAFWGGLIVSLPLALWEFIQDPWRIESFGTIAGVLYLGIISTALAAYLWNKAFEILESSLASLTLFAQPVFGALLGVMLLDEIITPMFISGGIMIGVGLLLAASEPSYNKGD